MLQALRIRDFRLLWGAGLVSSLGSWLLVLAVPAHVFLVTRSLAATGLTLAADYLPLLLLGPVAGTLTDRWDRRRLMIAADLFRAGVVAAMLLAISPGNYWIFYVALVAESSGTVLFMPALRARTPAVVGTGTDLSSANALNAVGNGIVRLIGGPLGGILLAVCGIRTLICVDALSYLASAVAIQMTSRQTSQYAPVCGAPVRGAPVRGAGVRGAGVRGAGVRGAGVRGAGVRDAPVHTIRRDLAEGFHVLRAQPVARALLPVTVIFLAANASLSAVIIPFGVQRLGGSQQTGMLFAALGVGFLLGAPMLRVLLDWLPPRILLTASLAATAIAYFLLFHSAALRTALPAAIAVGMFGSMSLVIPQTAVQRVVPNAVLGRVSAIFLTGEAAATLIGAVAGPTLAQAAQLSGVAAVASLTTGAGAVLAYVLIPAMPADAHQPPVVTGEPC